MPCNTPPPPFADLEEDVDEEPNMDQYDVVNIDEEMEGYELTDAIHVLLHHSDAVFCCKFDHTGDLAVTGSQDEKACVWNTVTGEMKFELTGFQDSVIAADFNHDSTLVATAAMDGKIFVWDPDSGEKMWSEDITEITWIKWHSSQNILFAGTVDGDCWKWYIPGNENCGFFPASGSGTSCGELMPDETKCVVGYMDGSVKIWDTNECTAIGSVTGKEAHEKNVISISCSLDGNLIATGSEDGTVKLIRTSNCKVLHTFNCNSLPESEEKESVENVAFFKSHPFLATATNAGNLRIFDISTHVERVIVTVDSPIVKLICEEEQPLVYIAVNGDVELYDARTGDIVRKYECHDLPILDFTLSRDRQKLMTCSEDFTCRIFEV